MKKKKPEIDSYTRRYLLKVLFYKKKCFYKN